MGNYMDSSVSCNGCKLASVGSVSCVWRRGSTPLLSTNINTNKYKVTNIFNSAIFCGFSRKDA